MTIEPNQYLIAWASTRRSRNLHKPAIYAGIGNVGTYEERRPCLQESARPNAHPDEGGDAAISLHAVGRFFEPANSEERAENKRLARTRDIRRDRFEFWGFHINELPVL
jgi:hypothetical protein